MTEGMDTVRAADPLFLPRRGVRRLALEARGAGVPAEEGAGRGVGWGGQSGDVEAAQQKSGWRCGTWGTGGRTDDREVQPRASRPVVRGRAVGGRPGGGAEAGLAGGWTRVARGARWGKAAEAGPRAAGSGCLGS